MEINVNSTENKIFTWGLTSGYGGAGLSSCAVCLGKILSRCENKKTLYISFEQHGPAESNYASELLIFRASISQEIDTITLYNGLDMDESGLYILAPGGTSNALWSSDEEELSNIIMSLINTCCFEHLILDIPPQHPCRNSLMRLCDHAVIVLGFTEDQRFLSEQVCKELYSCGIDDIIPVDNLYDEESVDKVATDTQLASEVRELIYEHEYRFGSL